MRRKRLFGSFAAVGLSAVLICTSSTFHSVIVNAQSKESAKRSESRAVLSSIEYQGTTVQLSEHSLYVDAGLSADELGSFAFRTLQDAVAAATPGTKENPTIIYLAPDVYWTDDYTKPEVRPSDDLIGLTIPQPYITLAGMTGNPEDVVIASDRGQNAGANGNFNTIGVGDGFHAKDITIGNYCNVDLVYKADPSKNHPKRQESITQAQAVTKVPGIEDMDEWFFENCHIISRLNLFSRDDRPKRSLLKDCHLECTDDSLGTGYITIFENCTFDLYSNTPCGGASFYMQAYLGCDFTTHLSDNKIITLCKNTKPFAFIDCNFKGDMQGMEWKQNNLSDDLRQIVYNNKLNGQDFVISPSRPELSVTPNEQQLQAFKYNGEYNIYNLLNGAGYEEWDPLGQKSSMPVSTWNIQFDYPGITKDVLPELEGNQTDALVVTPIVLGGTDKNVQWSVSDDTLQISPQADGTVVVSAKNMTLETKKSCLTATASNGMQKVLYFNVTPAIVDAPTLAGAPVLSEPKDGVIEVSYVLNGLTEGAKDISQVNWYRASQADGSDKVLVAQTTYVRDDSVPYTAYALRNDDVGKYIFCEVVPKASNSKAGSSMFSAASVQIEKAAVSKDSDSSYNVDLEHLAYIPAVNDTQENNYEWTNSLESGSWYGGFYLPAEYREGGIWADKAYKPADEAPYTYAEGASGAQGTYGLQTTTQGARLVYVDTKERQNMKMTLELSPHKTAAQGFGSAKQFMDIYFKYDAITMTGYGLRIARVPEISNPALADYAAKSCTFTLMEYKNGIATPLTEGVVSTAFLPGCTVVIEMKDNVLTADVTTVSEQDSASPAELVHEVHLKHTFEGDANRYSGFGLQHTGTAGAGKSGNRTTIHSLNVEYTDEVVNNPDDVTPPENPENPDNPNNPENPDSNDQNPDNPKPVVPDSSQNSNSSVQTGDTKGLYAVMYAVLAVLSAAVLAGYVVKKRKHGLKLK